MTHIQKLKQDIMTLYFMYKDEGYGSNFNEKPVTKDAVHDCLWFLDSLEEDNLVFNLNDEIKMEIVPDNYGRIDFYWQKENKPIFLLIIEIKETVFKNFKDINNIKRERFDNKYQDFNDLVDFLKKNGIVRELGSDISDYIELF